MLSEINRSVFDTWHLFSTTVLLFLACHECEVDEDEGASKTCDRRHSSEDRKYLVRCVVKGV